MNINYIIAFLCLCLLAFMLYKEFARAKKARLVFRILVSILTVLALAFLWFPLKYSSKQTSKQNELVLVTEGVDLDSIKKEKSILYTTDSAVLNDFKSSKIKYLPSLAYHLADQKNINSVKIIGYGLSDSELKKLKSYSLNFQKSALPNGVQTCNWPDEIFSGEDLLVNGIYQNHTSKEVKLTLKGLGTNVDSVIIKSDSTKKFGLVVKPKQIGKSVYQLLALNGKDTLQTENLAFKVLEKQPLRFLILASTPDFEYKFLKNWLFENSYSVVFRSQISKNIFSFDYLNTSKVELKQITSQNLKTFDVLIADDAALANLSSPEVANIQNQISNNGLGLLIRSIDAKSVSKFSNGFTFNEFQNQKSEELKLKFPNENFAFIALQTKQGFYLKESAALQTLITDEAKHALVVKKISGSGKVILNTVSSTFQWMLNGKTNDYTKFWSSLINQAVKPKVKEYQLAVYPKFSTQEDYLTIDFSQNGSQVPQLKIKETSLKPLQNKALNYQWQAPYVPKKAGWHSLIINQKDSIDFYVYKPNAWQIIKQVSKIEGTNAFVKARKQKEVSDFKIISQQEKEISKWWFLMLFLISTGYLWYEERIAS